MESQLNVTNKADEGEDSFNLPITAFGSKSCEQLLNLAIDKSLTCINSQQPADHTNADTSGEDYKIDEERAIQ